MRFRLSSPTKKGIILDISKTKRLEPVFNRRDRVLKSPPQKAVALFR